jgi:hypothetical protein
MKSTNERKKYITDYFIFKQPKRREKRNPTKRHENMTDMHPINFSHKDIVGDDGKQHTTTHLNHGTYIRLPRDIQHQVKRIIIAK